MSAPRVGEPAAARLCEISPSFCRCSDNVQTFADLLDATLVLELGERVAALALPTRQPRGEDFEVAVGHVARSCRSTVWNNSVTAIASRPHFALRGQRLVLRVGRRPSAKAV